MIARIQSNRTQNEIELEIIGANAFYSREFCWDRIATKPNTEGMNKNEL